MSRSEAKPIKLIRGWMTEDGEQMVGLHPLYVGAMSHFGIKPGRDGASFADDPSEAVFADISRIFGEISDGQRRIPEELLRTMLEVDAIQQIYGAPDENLEDLAEVLRDCWKG